MKNQIRFSQLIESAGEPEPVTLWEDPKRNAALQKAIKGNRVVTLVQKPTGHKKDFGMVGFHQQPFATYLIFPKALAEKSGARIIGINYDLLQEPEAVKGKARAKETKKAPKVKSQPKSVEKIFEIQVRRKAVAEVTISIRAKTKADAKEKALEEVRGRTFEVDEEAIEDEVRAVRLGQG